MKRTAAFALAALAAATATVGALAAGAAENFDFMPRGGRALLLEIAGKAPARLREITQARRTEAQWRAFAEAQKALAARERTTLAAYLAVNMPMAAAPQDAKALPPDGRDLAWEQCQSCHSLFAGFLTQSGNAVRWRNMFLAPFHRNMKMSPQEREEFARYAEINMPMKVEDIPPDLRF